MAYGIVLNKKDKKYSVVEFYFDDYDFDSDRFLKDKYGDVLSWVNNGKAKAREFLNKVINPEFIDEDDLIPNNENMYRMPIEEWGNDD